MKKLRWIIRSACFGITSACIETTAVDKRVVTIPHVPKSFLRVEAKNGHISITKRDGNDVRITAIFKAITDERLNSARLLARHVEGDTLAVNADWPERKGNESVSFEIEIPDVSGLEAHTRNDWISISNLSGAASLRTSNDHIEIHNHDGPVIAETSNDWIRTDNVTGSIVARTSNDRIQISNAHQSVHAITSNDRIDISLNDMASGPVLARTSNDDIALEVGVGFVGKLSLRAGEHTIVDEPLQERKIDKTSGAELLHFGDGEDSNLKTNGSIYLKSLDFED